MIKFQVLISSSMETNVLFTTITPVLAVIIKSQVRKNLTKVLITIQVLLSETKLTTQVFILLMFNNWCLVHVQCVSGCDRFIIDYHLHRRLLYMSSCPRQNSHQNSVN